jgi:malto-oligosyltrehalose trehalohydrolase
VRREITEREIHLVLENDRNEARYLARTAGLAGSYTAQWNDDLHHALHVLTTGESAGYYSDYAAQPAAHLGRALAEGFAYQGEVSRHRRGRRRGEPSAALPGAAFVAFLQNHDHVGNQPFGTRLSARTSEASLHAAVTIVLLSPQIPLLFMGEEWSSGRPFLFFCDFEPGLADAVREGRRREFTHFPELRDEAARERIPDPTQLSTFQMSQLDWAEPDERDHAQWLARYRRLLAIRTHEVVPRLRGMPAFAGSYLAPGAQNIDVEWRLGDRSRLRLIANFAAERIIAREIGESGRVLYASAEMLGAPESAAFVLLPPIA